MQRIPPLQSATQTRTASFTYDANTGLLIKELIEPDTSALCRVTEYAYDRAGNKTSTIIRAPIAWVQPNRPDAHGAN